MKHLLYILILLPGIAFAQANRVKQIQDNTGVFRGSIPPTDTSLTWRNTTDGQSYFWDSGASAWNIVQFNYQVDSVGQIALNSYPTGARIDSKGYYEIGDGGGATYYVYDSKVGYEDADTLGAVWETFNSKYAIMDVYEPLNVLSLGVNREQEVSGGNDTEVMQKIFEYCAKTLWHEVIYVPRAFVDIDETLYYDGTIDDRGFSIRGETSSASSSYGSSFIFRGANYDTMFIIEQVKDLFIENIDVNGNNAAGIGVLFKPLSNNIQFDKCKMSGFIDTVGTYSACISADPIQADQISEITISGSKLNGATYGFVGGNANNKNFYLYNNSFQQNDTAIWIGNTGSAEISGNTFSGNGVCIACVSCKGTVTAGNESEQDSLFYYAGENSSIMQSHILINNFSSIANGKKIAVYGDGKIQMIGNTFDQSDGNAVQVQWADAASRNDAIYAVQNYFQNSAWIESDTDTFPFINLSGNIYSINNLQSIQTYGGGTGASALSFPDRIRLDQGRTVEYDGNMIYTANNPTSDTFRVEGYIQAESNMILGSAGGTGIFSFFHENDQIQWGTSYIQYNGKHLRSGFGVWLRGTSTNVKGMDQSGIVGSSGFGLYNNSNEFFTATSAGDVGIGGVSPTEQLHVNGNSLLDGNVFLNTAKDVGIFTGTGSPESAVTANIGSIFLRTDGGTGTTLYVKETGAGNTGWVAK